MSPTTNSSRPPSTLKPRLLSTHTEYQSAPTSDDLEDAKLHRNASPETKSSSRPLWKILAIQLFCLAWIAPVTYLLHLNLRKFKIGASAWCLVPALGKKCWVDAFNNDPSVPQSNLAKLAAQGHDFNNVLLYVAKLLEIWFSVIAGSFMYLLVMRVAGSSTAIPIRLLTLPTEFPNLMTVSDRNLWKSISSTNRHSHSHRWTFLVVTAVFTGLVSNLMVPAIGALVLPTLKWVDMPVTFTSYLVPGTAAPLFSAEVPTTSGYAFIDSNCSAADFEAGRWSCASKWSHVLDGWVSSAFVATKYNDEEMYRAISPQGEQSLNVNFTQTQNDNFFWVPSRWMLQDLDNDRTIVSNIAKGFNSTQLGMKEETFQQYAAYNSSLGIQLQRIGPVLGANINLEYSPWSQWYYIEVDQNRSIFCSSSYLMNYPIFEDDFTTNFTKCWQTATPGGSGWPVDSSDPQSRGQRTVRKRDSFAVDALKELNDDTYDATINITVFGSGAAVLLPNNSLDATDEQTSLPVACLTQPRPPSGLACNWTHFFSSEYNRYSLSNETADVSLITFSQNTASNETIGFLVDYIAWLGSTVYELDPWPTSNPLGLVQMPFLSTNIAYSRLPIDPSWVLAAWTVDQENGHVPANRTIAQMLQSIFYLLQTGENIDGYSPDNADSLLALALGEFLPIAQALSLIDYNSSGTQPDPAYESSSTNTLLQASAKIYVWAYGFDSKTAKLGAAVAIVGCLITLVQFVFALSQRRKHRSLTQIVLAALAHEPRDHFIDAGDELHEQVAVQFSVRDAESKIGGLTFERVRRGYSE